MNATLAVLGLSGGELILIFAVILILFGAKKIPEFAKGLGQGMKEFKKASREVADELQNAMEVDTTPPPPKSIAQHTASEQSVASQHSPATHEPASTPKA